jgi:hypothetical protein
LLFGTKRLYRVNRSSAASWDECGGLDVNQASGNPAMPAIPTPSPEKKFPLTFIRVDFLGRICEANRGLIFRQRSIGDHIGENRMVFFEPAIDIDAKGVPRIPMFPTLGGMLASVAMTVTAKPGGISDLPYCVAKILKYCLHGTC